MKKLLAILFAIAIVMALSCTALADEEVTTVEEITEAENIAEEEETQKKADQIVEQLDNEKVNQLIEIIDQYANKIDAEPTTFWGKVKNVILENKSEVALVLIGIAFLVSAYIKKKGNKELSENVATMNNNAVQVANDSAQAIKEDKEAITELLTKLAQISDSDDLLQAMVNENTTKLNEKEEKNKNILNAVVESNQALAMQIEALLVLSNISDEKKEAIRKYMDNANAQINELKRQAED